MKLFKFISSSGIISRRKAQESIQLAMVTVNNVLVMDPFKEIDPVKDDIRLDDQKIILNSNNTTIILYKPKGLYRHEVMRWVERQFLICCLESLF